MVQAERAELLVAAAAAHRAHIHVGGELGVGGLTAELVPGKGKVGRDDSVSSDGLKGIRGALVVVWGGTVAVSRVGARDPAPRRRFLIGFFPEP